jgi:hypothetical protein
MQHKPVESLTEADLNSLVSEGRREDSQLEFKLTLPGTNDDEKREFLKDVSSMANSQGGDIIYGIREERSNPEDAGKAAEVVGITSVGVDATKLWMSELLNSSVEERLIGVVIRETPLNAGGFALVIRVPRSWNAPHVVRHRSHWRFYARNSAGVFAMNVTDLRTAFLLSDTLVQRLEAFRQERMSEIFRARPDISIDKDWSGHKPSSTSDQRKSLLIVHLQPFDSVKSGYVIDVAELLNADAEFLRFCSDRDGDVRLNFDGVLVTDADNVLQVYRSSATEELDSGELSSPRPEFGGGNREDVECIGATELDRAMFKGVGRRLALLKNLGLRSPILVSVSLINVMGCKLLTRFPFYVGGSPGGIDFRLSSHAIDRQNLFLTGLVIENLQELLLGGFRETPHGREYDYWHSVQGLMRPYCDTIWNAAGYRRSEYFSPDGRWLGEIYRGQ